MNTKWIPLTLMGLTLALPLRAAAIKGTDKQVDKLAAQFKVPESQITDLRAKGLGWGEISNALAISQKAGAPLADVLKLRDSHMGWGKIAQKYGFKLGDAVGKPHEERAEHSRRDKDSMRGAERFQHGPGAAGGGPHGHR